MQISFVMPLFSDQNSGRGKSFQGGKLPQGALPPPPVEESQKIVLLPLPSIVLVTIGCWFIKMSSLKCVNFKFRYLFFNKSRKCISKHKIAYAVHKIFLFFLIALTFDVKVPSKTYYNMESEMRTYHQFHRRVFCNC